MGHTRLGEMPKSKRWREVVALLSNSENITSQNLANEIQEIAFKTLHAAETGLEKAVNDIGLQYSFYLLTQVALASREDDWHEKLSNHNIEVSDIKSTFELISEVQFAIDDYVSENGRATDVSEMAQQALGEALGVMIEFKAQTLFGSGEKEIRQAVKSLSTKKGFSTLGQRFFGNFMAHYLNFYLSRATAAQVATGKLRGVEDVSRFNQVLQTHCEQTARIVRDFCGEWYSKTQYLEGINLENTSRFMSVALKKLKSELKKQKIKT